MPTLSATFGSAVASLALLATWCSPAKGAEEAAPPLGANGDRQGVVARVHGQPIRRGQVLHELQRALGDGNLDPQREPWLQATMLEQLVRRSLILQYLRQNHLGASQQDVAFQLEQTRRRLAKKGLKLEDYVRQQGLTQDQYRQQLAWQLGWPRYLRRHLNDDTLKKQFAAQPRDYDGTQLRVAHILLAVPGLAASPSDRSGVAAVVSRAGEIRRRIVSGELTFAEAASEYSGAPTAKQGGDLGWISRHQPMPEAFNRAAFVLQPGETSPPVVTHFGVHLIHCLQSKPGTRHWQDAREQLRRDFSRRIFLKLADYARKQTPVQYTGAMPHLDPENGKLIRGKP